MNEKVKRGYGNLVDLVRVLTLMSALFSGRFGPVIFFHKMGSGMSFTVRWIRGFASSLNEEI